MTKKIGLLMFASFALVLAGSGCQQAAPADENEKTEETAVEEETTVVETTVEISNGVEEEKQETVEAMEGFTATGEALGEGSVKLSWRYDEELADDARFIFVRSEEENPEHTGNNYWYRVHGSKREATWIDVPEGTYHFRICQVDEKEGECKNYSNDIELEVK